ncbi:MAG: DUF3299 domain-containing protein [Planctomycetes bacterium]|nr:DUF3299 domain-containing protein [Planctomycetota bacterium]
MFRQALLLTLLGLLVPATEDPVRVGFSELANFEYTPGMQLPKEILKYNARRVEISGFMKREDGLDGETEYFLLINDACGCNGTPKLNEIVFCAMPAGQKTAIRPGTVHVTGTLDISEEKEDGVVVSLYGLEVESIR